MHRVLGHVGGRQISGSEIAAAWVHFVGVNATIIQSYNATSVTRNGVGDYTLTWQTAFATASSYAIAGGGNPGAAQGIYLAIKNGTNPTTTSVTILCEQGNVALTDPATACCLAIGRT